MSSDAQDGRRLSEKVTILLRRSEPHEVAMAPRLNRLRAGVLGANDGIVSTAGLVVGVAGATSDRGAILTAGFAGLLAGAISMGLGEYISVSSQRDSERSQLATERRELAEDPQQELEELAELYAKRGLQPATARLVALELTKHDALAAHADAELRIDPEQLTNPWHAATASAAAFTLGALLPLVAILLPTGAARVPVTMAAVLAALALTGWSSSKIGGGRVGVAVSRIVVGGGAGLALTYVVGRLFGTVIS
jgi:VIT1/CCC1 family predicted Fe2+/Mn2+ transporter